MSCIIGIDEAGRGPLAGPVAVGAVRMETGFAKRFLRGVRDSKKLSAEERELWYSLAVEARKRGEIDFAVSLVSHTVIDRRGIAYAVRLGIKRCLKRLAARREDQVYLDGSLRAPEEFRHQMTIIGGDDKVPVISLASIAAKVTRDRHMMRLSAKYPEYGFHIHKGYATKAHRAAIKRLGPSEIHRKSFLRNILAE